MIPGKQDWTCLGPAPEHSADLEWIEQCYRSGSTEIDIQRCRVCAQLYRVERFEVSDWSGGGDYYDATTIWSALDENETEAVRSDPNYKPRSGRQHRHDSGWKRE